MGNEQSGGGHGQPLRSKSLTRTASQEARARQGEDVRPSSPGPSICSDSDLPYISYTVNRPIGDSPKLQQKHLQRGKSSTSAGSSPRARSSLVSSRSMQQATKKQTRVPAHNIVVVKPAIECNEMETDEDQLRLRVTPMFLPIMRGTLNLPAARDPEVLERLDPGGLLALGTRYQNHFATCAELVTTEQNLLGARIREVDTGLNRLMDTVTERQKRFAKLAEKMSKVNEVSAQLNRCHSLLNQLLESMETLNNSLAVDERLEPFVWTTG